MMANRLNSRPVRLFAQVRWNDELGGNYVREVWVDYLRLQATSIDRSFVFTDEPPMLPPLLPPLPPTAANDASSLLRSRMS